MSETGISWCDATWNPFVGCSKVSPACANCYAEAQAARIVKMMRGVGKVSHYESVIAERGGAAVWSGDLAQAPEKARFEPLHWRKPRDIFVGSMTDVFHPAAPRDWQIEAFAIAALAPQHRFLFLTKRAKDMRVFLSDPTTQKQVWTRAMTMATERGLCFALIKNVQPGAWPLPNVAIGVTVEDQPRADERRNDLGALVGLGWQTFVSYEPALGPVDWRNWAFLKLLISGGESSNAARPAHPDWFRRARDFSAAAGIAFHFKQWGEYGPCELHPPGAAPLSAVTSTGRHLTAKGALTEHMGESGIEIIARFGTRRAGYLLDGREHRDRLPSRA